MTVQNVIDFAKENNLKVYAVDGYITWAWLVTPNGNVLGINKAYYGNGITFSLEYNPSQKTGSGCSCHKTTDEWDFGITELTLKKLEQLENYGLKYAHQFKAKLYNNVDEFLAYESKFWGNRIKEVA